MNEPGSRGRVDQQTEDALTIGRGWQDHSLSLWNFPHDLVWRGFGGLLRLEFHAFSSNVLIHFRFCKSLFSPRSQIFVRASSVASYELLVPAKADGSHYEKFSHFDCKPV
jgi:hypothetical protein